MISWLTASRLAGSDTSAVTATFCLMKLLENPVSYQALKKELDDLLTSPSDPIVDEITCNLPYLNAVIHETLRMLPPAAGGKMPCLTNID